MNPNLRDLDIEKCQGHTLANKTSQEHSQEVAVYTARQGGFRSNRPANQCSQLRILASAVKKRLSVADALHLG